MVGKIAVIGCGSQARHELLPAIKRLNHVCIVALCDVNEAALSLASELITDANRYLTIKELLDHEPEVDTLVMSLPHDQYLSAIQQTKSSLSIIKEKPLAASFQQAKLIEQISLERRLRLCTLTKRSFYPSYMKAKELLPLIGEVYQYSARHFIPNGTIWKGWRSIATNGGGGVLLDLGYHLLDIIIQLFGVPTSVTASLSNRGKEGKEYSVEDCASVLLCHEGGLHGSFQLGCLTGPKEESLQIRGTRGMLFFQKDRLDFFDAAGKLVTSEDLPVDAIEATANAIKYWHKKDMASSLQNLEHNVRIMETLDRIYRSSQE